MFAKKEMKKRIAVVLTLTMVLAFAAPLAAYAGDEDELPLLEGSETTTPSAIKIDYSEPADLAEALLVEYTKLDKNFAQCDSSSDSATVKEINAALNNTDKYQDENSDKWNTSFKSWAIVKAGSSMYVLLSEDDVNGVEADSHIEAIKVADDHEQKGIIKVKATTSNGKAYNIMDAASFMAADVDPRGETFEISKDCKDLAFLNSLLNDAVALAKTYTFTENNGYGSNTMAGRIDSPTADSEMMPGFNYTKLLRAIDELCGEGGKYEWLNLTIVDDAVAWCLLTNGRDKVTEMYFAVIDDETLNSYTVGTWIEVWHYAKGRLTNGYAPLEQNTVFEGPVDYRDTLRIDYDDFTTDVEDATTYTISYNANVPKGVSVEGMPADSAQLLRGNHELSDTTPERAADDDFTYQFEAWASTPDGTEKVNTVEIIDTDIELFAIWTATPIEEEGPIDEEPVVNPPEDEEPVVNPPEDEEPVVNPPEDEEPVVNPPEDDDDDDSDRGTDPVVNEETSEIIDEEVPLSQLPEEVTEIVPEEVPLAEAPEEVLIIAQEEVPLGNVPQTGDSNHTIAWYLLALLSILGLAALAISGRKAEKTK